MPIKILMPALSPTMTEGTLIRWLKKEGDTVKAGQVMAEIETDKATMEVEAVDEGVLAKIIVPEGTEGVPVNKVIAVLLEEGEEASALEGMSFDAPTAEASASPIPSSPPAEPTSTLPTPTESTATLSAQVLPLATPDSRIIASPLAKRMAAEKGLNLASIKGSGPRGRIVKADVLDARGGGAATAFAIPAEAYGEAGFIEVPLNNMRRTIARRLKESKQEVPHFYLTMDCHIDALMKLRSDINAHWPEDKISVNDFIVRAVALSLQKVPQSNVSYHDTVLRQYQASDVSVAVAIEGGLITPVVRSAEKKTLRQISAEVKDLASRARAGKLKPEEYQGGSFTISNLGMYGISQFAAILNPPQACILAVGAGEQRPVVKDGTVSVATVMTCTLSVDHRAVDGALGSEFLKAFKGYIEAPAALII